MAAPQVDGVIAGNASGVSTKTLALTTTQTDDVVIAVIGYELGAAQRDVTGVAGTTLGAFTRRTKKTRAGSNNETIEIWWAPAPAILSGENITVTWDAAFDDAAIVIFGAHGCADINAPWDTNAGLPFSGNSGSPPSVNFDTTGAPTKVLGIWGVVDSTSPAPPSGWTSIYTQTNNGGALAQSTCVEFQDFAAAQSGTNYTPTHHDAGVTVVDALLGAETLAPGRITQGFREVVGGGPGAGRVTQAYRLALSSIAPPGRVTQAHRLSVATLTPPGRITQAVRLTIAQAVDCATHWQQLWTITRTDGVIFRFTSLDADFELGGHVYKSCGSLMPSASEESSEMGSVANMELTGILSDESITEADLYGGKFDDAFVEIWLVPFQGAETPRRLAAGWIASVQHGEQGWTGEVTGPGARLDQQALVVPYAPSCRWTFGDSRCGVDLVALQTSGAVVIAENRGFLVTDAPDPGNGSQWENGRVIWTSGRNAGVTCEVKTVDFGGADGTEISLWALAPYLPEIGDTFDLQPGCDLSAATCKNVYSNLINFGGFKDVPGNDSLAETPIAKIDS